MVCAVCFVVASVQPAGSRHSIPTTSVPCNYCELKGGSNRSFQRSLRGGKNSVSDRHPIWPKLPKTSIIDIALHVCEVISEGKLQFCMQVGLLPSKRNCSYCKRELNLVAENRKDHETPVVYRCYNRRCKKYCKYVSVRDGTVFTARCTV